MSATEPLFQFDDPQLSERDVEARVRETIKPYQFGAEVDQLSYLPPEPAPEMAEDLRFALADLLARYDQVGVTAAPELDSSLIGRAKRTFHRLVIYYVNLSARRQVAVNTSVARALSLLSARVAADEQEIAALRREVRALRALRAECCGANAESSTDTAQHE
jgi:hypothetical protein